MSEEIYDVIIIGSGFGGLNAALYCARSGLKSIILDKAPGTGGQISFSSIVENWLGEKSISGLDLSKKATEHVQSLGVEIKTFTEVISAELEGKIKKIKTSEKEYSAKAVVIATGSRERPLNVPGEKEFKGKGVSVCALCDGAFFQDKEIAVIGGGNTALEEADFLTKFASKVYLIHRRNEFRAEEILVKRAEKNSKIEFVLNKTIEEIIGENNQITKIKVKDQTSNESSELNVSGVFVFIGTLPNSEIFNVNKDEKGYILTDEWMKTNIPGVFAAGDVRKQPINQLVAAAADGAVSAVSISKYLKEME